MTYEHTLEFLHARHASVYKGLERMRYVLAQLGNPHETFPAVLITGTNGKGSTAKIISTVLQAAGYRVGCFTSPHLVDFGERITIDAQQISPGEVIELVEELRRGPLAEIERERDLLEINGIVSFFEMVTAMAFIHFARRRIDIAILEVGIGGRLDATNTVNPLVSVITNVGLDHQAMLGQTVAAIAAEKAAIIRPGRAVVTGSRDPAALAVIESACREKNAALYQTGILDEETDVPLAAAARPHKISPTGSFFSYQGLRTQLAELYLRLAGRHQLANAAVALCALELLKQQGFAATETQLRAGLATVAHPGRLEILGTNPTVVVDIAHNAMGAQAIVKALTAIFDYDKLILIVGVLHDKDVPGILRPFLEVADAVIFTSPHHTGRAETAAATAQIAANLVNAAQYDHWQVQESVAAAIHAGQRLAGARDLICVTGSNYTVSEAEMLFQQPAKHAKYAK